MTAVASIDGTDPSPVLLLHCSASSGRQWQGLAGRLEGRFPVVAPDLHGYGGSPAWTGPGPLTLAAEAALATSALPSTTRSFHLVGHSYGGAVALRLAVEQPRLVRSLSLIEPVAFHVLRQGGRADRRLLEAVRRVAGTVIEGVLSGDYHGAVRGFVEYWNGRGAWQRTPADGRRRLSRLAPKIVLDFHAAMTEDTAFEAYRSRLSCPLLIARGERSPEPARRVAALLSERIPGARLVTVPGAGHMLPMTHPDRVNGIVLEHIGGCLASRLRAA